MKILIVLGQNLYDYQRQLLAELITLDEVEIFVLSCTEKYRIPKDSKLLRLINSKFPVIKTDPYSFEKTARFVEDSAGIETYVEDLFYDYVLNFCEPSVIENYKIKCAQVLKASMEIRSWYSASIYKSPYTTINLLSSSNNKNFIPLKSLSFSTETGFYNNRNKALYYFSYLVKSVFNANSYPVLESDKKDYHFVNNWIYHFKLLKIIFLRKFSKTQFNWKIALLENDVPHIITHDPGDFWADPFIIKESDNDWVFFEEFDRKTNLGKIAVINLQDNEPLKKEVVLEKPYHLSFPNVFKLSGEYFMMPEEVESGEQNIYKATEFPYKWEKCRTIFKETKVVDPVFIFHQEKYWLFFNKIEDFEYENNERLYLYSSPDLFSDQWESHPQNPVVINKTSARNAGKIIKEEQHYIRVSQNCKDTYGAHILKNRITDLNEKIYKEEKLTSTWDFKTFYGCHTVNTDGGITIIDLLAKEKNGNSQNAS